ncbi:MAG TPA: nitrilase-related carbon-nitrogen hydrolase [Solirubrobacteraceae bacterium]|nr:nitrilase-related carbon-nitrogen hydrolase [Solirubrobacteraceae bacterium]
MQPPGPSTLRITLAQAASRLGDVDANLARARELIERAGAEGSHLVVFPELFLTGYSLGQVTEDPSRWAVDPQLTQLGRAAPGTDVVVGFEEDGLGVHTYNAAGYYDAGGLRHVHRKLFLPTYDIFEERKFFSPGQSMRAFDTRWGRMATLICNDAWQAPLAFLAVQDGARVLVVPTTSAQSRFPERYDSRTYWRDITVFTARMLQCFVVFVNSVGEEAGLRFWGGSHVVDPWGRIICEAPEYEEALVTAEIDLLAVRRRRREVPLVREARLDLMAREAARLANEGGDF